MNYTAGPWRYDGRAYIWGPKHEMVAMIRGTGSDLQEEENARLLAAAPELFEMLKIAAEEYCSMKCPSIFPPVDLADGWPHVAECRRMQALISRVEGED